MEIFVSTNIVSQLLTAAGFPIVGGGTPTPSHDFLTPPPPLSSKLMSPPWGAPHLKMKPPLKSKGPSSRK